MSPVRLVYVTGSMPFGSGEEFLVPEANELMRQGCELLIVPRSPKGEVFNRDAADLEGHSRRASLLSASVVLGALVEGLRHPLSTCRVFKLILKSESAAVFVKNAAVLPKGLWLARLARRWGADHIHAHWGRTTATIGLVAAELTGIPWSLTLHRDDIAHPNLLSLKMRKAAFSRFISRSGLTIARDVGAPAPADTAVVIHMGARLPENVNERTAEHEGSAHEGFILLCPANLYPVKGHVHLLAAMGILRDRGADCTLWIAGSGGLLEALQNQVAALALTSKVRFLGQVDHERILAWYADGAVDAMVLPSVDLGDHEHEGIPVSLMEAMAHSVPVVSTETGGIPEMLGEGAGLLVPPGDAEALADALHRLLRDPALRSRLGTAGRRRIEEQYSVERTTEDLLAHIVAVVCGGNRRQP
jgi:colanic acid/amylovoran biosynthesis glycosyltransferase